MWLYVHGDHKEYKGRHGLLDLHTAPNSVAATSSVLLYVHRDQHGHLDFHTVPGLIYLSSVLLFVHIDRKDY